MSMSTIITITRPDTATITPAQIQIPSRVWQEHCWNIDKAIGRPQKGSDEICWKEKWIPHQAKASPGPPFRVWIAQVSKPGKRTSAKQDPPRALPDQIWVNRDLLKRGGPLSRHPGLLPLRFSIGGLFYPFMTSKQRRCSISGRRAVVNRQRFQRDILMTKTSEGGDLLGTLCSHTDDGMYMLAHKDRQPFIMLQKAKDSHIWLFLPRASCAPELHSFWWHFHCYDGVWTLNDSPGDCNLWIAQYNVETGVLDFEPTLPKNSEGRVTIFLLVIALLDFYTRKGELAEARHRERQQTISLHDPISRNSGKEGSGIDPQSYSYAALGSGRW